VVPSNPDVAYNTPGGVAITLGGISSAGRQVARFCVCILWQVQDVPDACRSHCVVFYIVFDFLRQQMKPLPKKKK
jgi:hypothetical protein